MAVLFGAGAVAGAINSLAGGGTLVSFPVLLWLGRDAIVANATNTVALCPGALAAMAAFRRDLGPIRRWMLLIVPPSLAGGLVGALLLLRTPERVFAALVPWLILFATVIFAAQGPIVATVRRFRPARAPRSTQGVPPLDAWPWVVAFELAVAIYGGYFGAGIGIMTLAVLGLVGFTDIHHMIGLRNFAALCINGIASVYFVAKGAVAWPDALVMIVGQVLGGYGGGRVARRLGRTFMRRAVVAIGVAMALSLLLARWC
ncbi:MAG: sulfite exporter TauE/SafE family protein [Deltaproteobacteria bacterium]|nr:sulfite exporter TauE/SafE family protein [Deltaproteobacteria bacterium]